MWPFPKKVALKSSGLFEGMVDCHSHILPGVDDGVQTIKESLAILAHYEELGIRRVWFTPHVMEDIPNKTADLQEAFETFKASYNGKIQLRLAAEYMLDTVFEERLAAADFLPHGEDGSRLLVETSYFNPPMDLYGLLEKIKKLGFHPLLAHPERYFYMTPDDYKRLKAMGVEFQLNVFALVGQYGPQVQKRAKLLLAEGAYNAVGTDVHRAESPRFYAEKKVEEKYLRHIRK